MLIDEDLPDLTGAELSYRLKAAARVTWGGKKCVTVAIRGDVTMDQVAGWSSSDYVVLKPLNYNAFDKLIVKCFKEAAETIEGTTDPK